MYPNESDLSTLVAARICHDLSNPIGAIGNGMELLELSGLSNTPELDLIQDSVNSAVAKVRFIRIAYGAAAGDPILSTDDIKTIIDQNYATSRMSVFMNISRNLDRPDNKLLFLGIQCLEAALPAGGRITVENTDRTWCFRGEGKIRVSEDKWRALTGNVALKTSDPGTVQFALLRECLRKQNLSAHTRQSDSHITLEIFPVLAEPIT